MVNETRTELAVPLDSRDDKYYFYEISNFELETVCKAFAFSYQVINDRHSDVNILLFVEYKNGKIVAVQHALSNSLDTIVKMESENLFGY